MSGRGAAVLAVDGGNSKIDLALVSRSGELLALVNGPDDLAPAGADGRGHGAPRRPRRARRAREAGRGAGGELGVLLRRRRRLSGRRARVDGAFAGAGVAERVSVHNDAFAALRAGAPDGWGVVVICGAGVNAAGVGPDGRTARLAGIGDLSGDWGGGQGIGREALAAAVRARDGRGPATVARHGASRSGSALRRPIDVTRRDVRGHDEHRAGSRSWRRSSSRSPAEGDAVARGIVDRLADELATMAVAIARQLRVARRAVDVVLTGGVFRATDAEFYARIEAGVRAAVPDARIVRLRDRPVLGAASSASMSSA